MARKLQLYLLGAPEIYQDGQAASFVTNKSQALLIYLALNPGWQARDLLAELLWPDMPTTQARKNLRDGLVQLRTAVGDWADADAQRIRFAAELPHDLDVTQFQNGLTQGQTAVDLSQVQTALKLYREDFLRGFHVRKALPFEEWVTRTREELHTQIISGLEWVAEQYFVRRDYTTGLTVNRRLLKLEPWRESAHRLQMQLLALSGRNSEALMHYTVCQRVLADELSVQPSAETVALYEQIRSGEFVGPSGARQGKKQNDQHEPVQPSKQPVADTATAFFHNLPRQMTPLIGRHEEMTILRNKLLEPSYPLLTLSGEGGIGKTRLAAAVAEMVSDHFPDGVWFVPLANLSPGADLPEQLAAAVGKAVGLTFAGAEALANQLFTQLRHKQLLLILDNFEHLLPDATFILSLLQKTRNVKILVTSRRRLNFQAEFLLQLDGLALPDEEEMVKAANGLIEPAQLLTYPGVALFVERASRIRPQFSLTQENQMAVLQICQLVAGLPLGVELAAAALRHLSCTQIATMLRQNYTILATNLPDLPARHHSMQTVIAYSWQLLTVEEAQILARCAVFRGGFTEEAAQAVAGAMPALLVNLEDHSLLHRSMDGRFEIHELVCQYAAEQLQRRPEDVYQVYERYSAYYTNFLALLEQGQNQDHTAQLAIRADLDNIRAAWLWAVDHAKVTALAHALKSLARFYYLMGFLSEAGNMLLPAVTRVRTLIAEQGQPAAELERLLARLLVEQAFFDAMLARHTLAEQSIQEAIQLTQGLADPALEVLCQLRLGDIAWSRADYHLHRIAYTRSLTLARQSELPSLEAHCLSNLGMSYDEYGEYPEAIACYEAALAIARRLGNRQQESIVYNNLGVSYGMLGDFGQAIVYHQQALQLSHVLGDQEGLGFAYLNQGGIGRIIGEEMRAQAALEQALTLFQRMNLSRLTAKTLTAFAWLYEQMGDFDLARTYCEQALALGQSDGYQTVQAEALTLLGYVLSAQGAFAAALEACQAANTVWKTIGQAGGKLLNQAGLAQIYLHQNDYTSALAVVDEILAVLNNTRLNATQSPGRIFWICYQTLIANKDVRAGALLQQGCQLLQTQAATLPDPVLQKSFLQNVADHRKLLAASLLGTPASCRPAARDGGVPRW